MLFTMHIVSREMHFDMNFCFLLCVRRQSPIGPREKGAWPVTFIVAATVSSIGSLENQAFSLHCQGRRGKLPEKTISKRLLSKTKPQQTSVSFSIFRRRREKDRLEKWWLAKVITIHFYSINHGRKVCMTNVQLFNNEGLPRSIEAVSSKKRHIIPYLKKNAFVAEMCTFLNATTTTDPFGSRAANDNC